MLGSQQQAAQLRGAAVALEQSNILKLKGLPYTTTEQQIREFFQGFNVTNVSFVYEPDGRPSGLAFAEFSSREEALQAMVRNGEYLGDRYVRLLHVPRQEMEDQVRMGTLAIPGQAQKMRQRMMRAGGMDGAAAGYAADGTPLMAQQLAPMGAAAGGQLYAAGGMVGQPPMLRQVQVVAPQGMSMQGMSQAVMGPAGMTAAGVGPGGMLMASGADGMSGGGIGMAAMGGLPPYQALMYQMGGMSLGPGGPRQPQVMAAPAMMAPAGYAAMGGAALASGGGGGSSITVIGTDSKTIKIRGLPFRATPLDILNFFEGYAYVPESLQLGVDALGRPSGEAWLTFESSEEALRSVREKNRQYLGSRYLELSLT